MTVEERIIAILAEQRNQALNAVAALAAERDALAEEIAKLKAGNK